MTVSWLNIIILILLAFLVPTAYAAKIGAPFVPAKRRGIQKAFSQIGLGKDDVFVELGCGDGRFLVEAAKTGATVKGYELSPIMWVIARLRTLGKKNITVSFKNFYKQPLNDATVVYTFLLPQNMERLRQSLSTKSMPRGKYFLSYGFALPNTKPLYIVREDKELPLYVYDLKALVTAT